MLIEFLHLGDHPGLYIIASKIGLLHYWAQKQYPQARLNIQEEILASIQEEILASGLLLTHVSSVVEALPKLVEISKPAKKTTLLFCVFLESSKSVPKQSGKQLRFQPANFRGMG